MPTKLAASVLSVVSAVTGFGGGQAAPPDAPAASKPSSLFEFRASALDGSPVDLGAHRGKVVLVVNVASKCGYTPQYSELEKVWKEFKDRGLVVIGFPCNDFGGQEPGSSSEIREFCTRFPMPH